MHLMLHMRMHVRAHNGDALSVSRLVRCFHIDGSFRVLMYIAFGPLALYLVGAPRAGYGTSSATLASSACCSVFDLPLLLSLRIWHVFCHFGTLCCSVLGMVAIYYYKHLTFTQVWGERV